jgi:hypothetical protein
MGSEKREQVAQTTRKSPVAIKIDVDGIVTG